MTFTTEGQLEFFDLLNDKSDAGDIKIEEDLTIVNGQVANPVSSIAPVSSVTVSHWVSCGGGINTGPSTYWWGYAKYACDCKTRELAADFNSAASVTGGLGVASVFFAAPLALPYGLTSAYWKLLASRLGANNQGHGCYIGMSWALVFDIAPQ